MNDQTVLRIIQHLAIRAENPPRHGSEPESADRLRCQVRVGTADTCPGCLAGR